MNKLEIINNFELEKFGHKINNRELKKVSKNIVENTILKGIELYCYNSYLYGKMNAINEMNKLTIKNMIETLIKNYNLKTCKFVETIKENAFDGMKEHEIISSYFETNIGEIAFGHDGIITVIN